MLPHACSMLIEILQFLSVITVANTPLSRRSSCSVVSLEWAGPGVGGGIVFPLSVSVGLALELLLSDVLVGVSSGRLLLKGGGLGGDGKNGEDE